MAYEEVKNPIPGPDAFGSTGDTAVLSQAALLLLVGTELRGDRYALSGRARARGLGQAMEAIPRSDLRRINPPRLRPIGGERINFESVQDSLESQYGARIPLSRTREIGEFIPQPDPEVCFDLAERLYQEPEPFNAAQLLELYVNQENELLRVAAAVSYFDLSAEPARLLTVLEEGTLSDEALVLDIAATALARIDPGHPRLLELTQFPSTEADDTPAHTSLLIHGTFARNSLWWQPGGDFHTYVLNNVRPDLYSGADRFDWSGGYSDQARALAADQLHLWIASKGLPQPGLFTHSHGGSVAMLASHQQSLDFGELVLLSCPVHVDKYMPDFNSVQKVVSIRVRLDLVILADRGGQRYRHPQIEENILPIWFEHSATHEPAVWEKHNVAALL
jgi:hypothetical protein